MLFIQFFFNTNLFGIYNPVFRIRTKYNTPIKAFGYF